MEGPGRGSCKEKGQEATESLALPETESSSARPVHGEQREAD